MELASHEHNFYSGAIVGGSLYMPLGGAFAQKYRGVDDISVSIIGDGVFDEGITYEIFNLAALYRLPFLIICENNKYAAHTPIEKRQAVAKLAERAQAFGIPFEKHDGNDAALLLQVLERIVPEIRAGKGPRCIEIATYRYCGHVGPAKTRAWAIAAKKSSSNGRCAIPSPRCAARLRQASKNRVAATRIERRGRDPCVHRRGQASRMGRFRRHRRHELVGRVCERRRVQAARRIELSKAASPKRCRGPSDMLSPESKSQEIGRSTQLSFAQSINAALRQALELDPGVFVCGIGADTPAGIFGTTHGAGRTLRQQARVRYPDRRSGT